MKVAYKKLTFRGQLFSPTIAKRSDRHFEKMTLGGLPVIRYSNDHLGRN